MTDDPLGSIADTGVNVGLPFRSKKTPVKAPADVVGLVAAVFANMIVSVLAEKLKVAEADKLPLDPVNT
jgi:hypothetical protein